MLHRSLPNSHLIAWYLQQAIFFLSWNSVLLHFFTSEVNLCYFSFIRALSLFLSRSLSAQHGTGSKRQEIKLCVCPASPPGPFVCVRACSRACVRALPLQRMRFPASRLTQQPLSFASFLQAMADSRLLECLTSPPGLGSNTKRILGARSQNDSRGADLGFFEGSHTHAPRSTGGCHVPELLGVDSLDDELFRMDHERIDSVIFLIANYLIRPEWRGTTVCCERGQGRL